MACISSSAVNMMSVQPWRIAPDRRISWRWVKSLGSISVFWNRSTTSAMARNRAHFWRLAWGNSVWMMASVVSNVPMSVARTMMWARSHGERDWRISFSSIMAAIAASMDLGAHMKAGIDAKVLSVCANV